MERRGEPKPAEATRNPILDAPVLIYVYCLHGPNEEVTQEKHQDAIRLRQTL